jgi:hypothetical protein
MRSRCAAYANTRVTCTLQRVMSSLPVPPKVQALPVPLSSDRNTDVDVVSYSLEELHLLVSTTAGEANVRFDGCVGFRVLDEQDLTEFWSECSLNDGWLFEVYNGGWRDLESTRPSFHRGRLKWMREFLVVGRDACVSVIAKAPPDVSVVDTL